MFDNLYITQRIQKAQALREQNLNPYSNDLTRTMDNATFLRTYAHLLDSSQALESTFDNAPILANSAKDSRIVDEKSIGKGVTLAVMTAANRAESTIYRYKPNPPTKLKCQPSQSSGA